MPDTELLIQPSELKRADQELRAASTAAIIEWAADRYGDQLCIATSFTDTVLVHAVTQVMPDIPVVFLHTGLHFPETLETMKKAQAAYSLNLKVIHPEPNVADLWTSGVESCCEARKVLPLERGLREAGFKAWFSGVRWDDSPERANSPVVGLDSRDMVKVNPIVSWTNDEVDTYIEKHDLVSNPLLEQGYTSIGCWPCTMPALTDDDARSGRWVGASHTECGLHR